MWKYNSHDVIKVLLNHVWEGLTLLCNNNQNKINALINKCIFLDDALQISTLCKCLYKQTKSLNNRKIVKTVMTLIIVFTIFRLLTEFVCLYTYEF